jgi:hypothetical protein
MITQFPQQSAQIQSPARLDSRKNGFLKKSKSFFDGFGDMAGGSRACMQSSPIVVMTSEQIPQPIKVIL